MKNIVAEVIEETDMAVLQAMSKKYNMTVADFGRFIGKVSNEKGVRFHIRFSVDEMEIVNRMASNIGTSRSKICVRAWREFLSSGAYKKFNVREVKDKDMDNGRTERVCVIFQDHAEYEKLKDFASKYSIAFSALLRYCVLNYNE